MKFDRNVGDVDRMIRFGAAAVLIVAGYLLLASPLNYAAYVVALIMIGTGATKRCALYSLVGVSTMKKEVKK